MQIHVKPVLSVLVQLKYLTPFIMTDWLTELGGGLDSNGSRRHCQLMKILFLCLFII